jgi:hypothetical protein
MLTPRCAIFVICGGLCPTGYTVVDWSLINIRRTTPYHRPPWNTL